MEKSLRKECNRQGIALFIYKMIMSTAVTVVMIGGTIGYLFRQLLQGQVDMEHLLDGFVEHLLQSTGSGWGYMLAIAIGVAILLIWKKPTFIRREILKKGRPMGVGSFATILCLFMAAQIVSQLGLVVMDGLLGFFGKSMTEYMQSAAMDTDTFSMWLYAGLGAPIFEEILFRGLIMRSLEPYGKRMSILVSALLFGFFHGNPVQAPYAALVGMVLGYVAMEHNIIWAMVLHMFNNLIFADTFFRLIQELPLDTQNYIVYGVMIAFAIAALILLIVKRRQVMESIRKDIIQPWQYNAAFLSPMILVVIASCVADMALFVLMLMIA